jgi:hypothetical protein
MKVEEEEEEEEVRVIQGRQLLQAKEEDEVEVEVVMRLLPKKLH